MTRYLAYLETAADGRCLAHVLDLPGCIVLASSCREALDRLPRAIRCHCDWLHQHGETMPCAGLRIQIEVAEEKPDRDRSIRATPLHSLRRTSIQCPPKRWSSISA
jgi:predicted RNase H-like HicB family nuclease